MNNDLRNITKLYLEGMGEPPEWLGKHMDELKKHTSGDDPEKAAKARQELAALYKEWPGMDSGEKGNPSDAGDPGVVADPESGENTSIADIFLSPGAQPPEPEPEEDPYSADNAWKKRNLSWAKSIRNRFDRQGRFRGPGASNEKYKAALAAKYAEMGAAAKAKRDKKELAASASAPKPSPEPELPATSDAKTDLNQKTADMHKADPAPEGKTINRPTPPPKPVFAPRRPPSPEQVAFNQATIDRHKADPAPEDKPRGLRSFFRGFKPAKSPKPFRGRINRRKSRISGVSEEGYTAFDDVLKQYGVDGLVNEDK